MPELNIASALNNAGTEGLYYRSSINPTKNVIMRAAAPSIKALAWKKQSQDQPLSELSILKALHLLRPAARGRFVMALSHDDYVTIGGGVQNCVGDEQAAMEEQGWDYLHLCPNDPKPMLGPLVEAKTTSFIMNLNGTRVGVVLLADLLNVILRLRADSFEMRCVIHHLMGYAPENAAALIAACGDEHMPIVWIHDTFTLCPSVAMLRNEATFCDGPIVNSSVCGICHAGLERSDHVARLSKFFQDVNPVILAPSQTILDFWVSRGSYRFTSAKVIPLCAVQFDDRSRAFDASQPLRVAFFGSSWAFHKGWSTFETLARWHANDPRYEFFHLGSGRSTAESIHFAPAMVSRAHRDAMINTAVSNSIDVLINWTRCYESFSFATYEALAAGAYVVAPSWSGNVSRMLLTDFANRGTAVESEIELSAMFETGSIIDSVKHSHRHYGRLTYARGVGELLSSEQSIV